MSESTMITEQAFLQAILEHPDDDAGKLVYADWLEEQGDPRAEFLRLTIQVRRDRAITPEQRRQHNEISRELARLQAEELNAIAHNQKAIANPDSGSQARRQRLQELRNQLVDLSQQFRQAVPKRLQELAAILDANWLAAVSDPLIEGCAKSHGSGWKLRFDFVCDKSWADLQSTGDDRVRHCGACEKNVYYCDNIADAREHTEKRHCVAVDLGIIRRDGDLNQRLHVLGRPSPEQLRIHYEEDIDPVSQARLKIKKKAEMRAQKLARKKAKSNRFRER